MDVILISGFIFLVVCFTIVGFITPYKIFLLIASAFCIVLAFEMALTSMLAATGFAGLALFNAGFGLFGGGGMNG